MKKKSCVVAVMLAIIMAFTMTPIGGPLGWQMVSPVFADETEDGSQALVLGSSVLSQNVNTANAPVVYFGVNNLNPHPWYVIGYNSREVLSTLGDITLIRKENMGTTKFSNGNNEYSTSLVREMAESVANDLTDPEQASIIPRTLETGGYDYRPDNTGQDTNGILGDPVVDAPFWLLSPKEAVQMSKDLRITDPENHNWSMYYWWLRSPGRQTDYAGYVNGGTGYVSGNGASIWESSSVYGVRPAFKMNMSSILLTTAAENSKGKVSGTGAGALKRVEEIDNNEWKLTLYDQDRNQNFSASAGDGAVLMKPEGYTAWNLPIDFSGAGTNNNEYVSAILCDEDDNALYYGHISKSTAEQSVTIRIPTGLGEGNYYLHVFSEQINGDKLSDYASEFRTIPLSVGDIPVSGVSLNKPELELTAGEKESLRATVTPSDATNKAVRWKSDNEDIALVDQNGVVTAQSDGTTTITAETVDGGYTATCEVTVLKGTIYYSVFFVDFVDGAGNLLKSERVVEGNDATAPEDPVRDGYVFCGWNKSFRDITEDTLVTAKWKKIITDADVVLSSNSFTYDGEVQRPTVKTIGGMYLTAGTDYIANWSNRASTNAGTYKVTITAEDDSDYYGTTAATYTINKAANPLTIKAKTATVKYNAVKKKTQTLAVTKVIAFTKKGQGTMTYTKASGNKMITINKSTGKVTVKKGLKKGTYKVKVKLKAAGNANYKASAVKAVTFKVTVK